jgi:NADH dehydrogenase
MTLARLVREVAQASRLPCHLLSVPDGLAWVQAGLMEWVPGKPFSLDNMRSLMSDSVCRTNGCAQLGIEPGSLTAWLPQWLAPRT